eukprot:15370273-Alexandrium_andersonii.AAC.1
MAMARRRLRPSRVEARRPQAAEEAIHPGARGRSGGAGCARAEVEVRRRRGRRAGGEASLSGSPPSPKSGWG